MFRSRIKKVLTCTLGDCKDTWRNYYIPMSRCRNNLLYDIFDIRMDIQYSYLDFSLLFIILNLKYFIP